MARKRSKRTSEIAQRLTRAVGSGSGIRVEKSEAERVKLWVNGTYIGWLPAEQAQNILGTSLKVT